MSTRSESDGDSLCSAEDVVSEASFDSLSFHSPSKASTRLRESASSPLSLLGGVSPTDGQGSPGSSLGGVSPVSACFPSPTGTDVDDVALFETPCARIGFDGDGLMELPALSQRWLSPLVLRFDAGQNHTLRSNSRCALSVGSDCSGADAVWHALSLLLVGVRSHLGIQVQCTKEF